MDDVSPRALSAREQREIDDPAFAKALELVRFYRDPATKTLWPLLAIGFVGFLGIALGWRAAARTLAVPLQMPAFVSGGLGGLLLVGLACLIASIHFSRGDAARERREIDDLITEARLLLEVAPHLRPRRVPAQRRARSARPRARA